MESIFFFLPASARPGPGEVDRYTDLIIQCEHREPAQWDACRSEAELQLWSEGGVDLSAPDRPWRRTRPPQAKANRAERRNAACAS